jgi:hypothetical protein
MQREPLRRRAKRVLALRRVVALGAFVAVASGCSGASHQAPPPAVHGSAVRPDYEAALAIVKADGVFAKVRGGTPYRVVDQGPFEGRRSAPGGQPDLVGVVFRIDLDHPLRVDVRVPGITGPWPRGTAYFDAKASYVRFRSQLTGTVVDLAVVVDLRSESVIGISPGPASREASLRQMTDPGLLPPIAPTPQ